ncbi:hypothetical protein CAEBREN_09888 [Caenorhabditis brenneri]|uniref:Uncharacterized protein n=1 Tax=Caenorhabditis brenneri TaxID=135651 RepID=G0NUC6_CAEBE|nr:hypothetical protein CAEBREN_09888 [Caenorhabditis brenneri]
MNYNYQPQIVEVHHVHYNHHYHYDMGADLKNLPLSDPPPPQNYEQFQGGFQDFGGWYNYQPQVVEVHHVHYNYHYRYDMGTHLENLPDAHHQGQPQDLHQHQQQQWEPLDEMEMEIDFHTDDEMDSAEEEMDFEEKTDGAETEEDQV